MSVEQQVESGVLDMERVKARRIVLLRHGQTDFNLQRRFQGVIDRPLNERGIEQARAAAEVLASRFGSPSQQVGVNLPVSDVRPVRVVASPLLRAFRTAEIVAEELARRGVVEGEVIADDRLRERGYGVFEGHTKEDVVNEFPQWFRDFRKTGESVDAGVENADDVAARMVEAVNEYSLLGSEGATLIVVSHGAAIGRGIIGLLGLKPSVFDGLKGNDNCHWSELVVGHGGGTGGTGEPSWRLAAHNIGAREDVLGG